MEILEIKKSLMPKVFFQIKHALLALQKWDEYPRGLQFINITKKHIVGCDGHRIHLSDNSSSLKIGLYRVLNNRANSVSIHREVEAGLEYPNYEHIINTVKLDTIKFSAIYADAKIPENAYYRIIRVLPESKIVKLNFISDAAIYAGDEFGISKDSIIIMKTNDKLAILMPILAG